MHIKLTVVENDAQGRLVHERYALITLNRPRVSFNYHAFTAGSHVGCATLESSSINRVTADAVVSILRGAFAPQLVFVTEEAFRLLEPVFTSPAVTFRQAKMVA